MATLLPGTAFFLGLPYAPARRLIERGVAVALASDCNPGTCPTENLPLVGAMACTQMRMLPGRGRHRPDAQRRRRPGPRPTASARWSRASRPTWSSVDVPDYRHLFYHFGVNHVWRVIKRGRVVYAA